MKSLCILVLGMAMWAGLVIAAITDVHQAGTCAMYKNVSILSFYI